MPKSYISLTTNAHIILIVHFALGLASFDVVEFWYETFVYVSKRMLGHLQCPHVCIAHSFATLTPQWVLASANSIWTMLFVWIWHTLFALFFVGITWATYLLRTPSIYLTIHFEPSLRLKLCQCLLPETSILWPRASSRLQSSHPELDVCRKLQIISAWYYYGSPFFCNATITMSNSNKTVWIIGWGYVKNWVSIR